MPRYDYRCTSCGKTFEVSHGMREHPDIVCPDCGGTSQRIFDVSGIVLKGSGFYNTDQRGKKGTTPATGGKDPEGSSAGAPAEKSRAREKNGAAPSSDTSKTEAGTSSKSEPSPAKSAD